MSSDQARRFELYRHRAEGVLDRTVWVQLCSGQAELTSRQEGRRLSRQELIRDLTDDQEALCVEDMRRLAEEVLAEVEELGSIFGAPAGGDQEEPDVAIDEGRHAERNDETGQAHEVYDQVSR